MKKNSFFIMFVILIILQLVGCGANSTQSEFDDSAPSWVNTPSRHDGYYWGVGFSDGNVNLLSAKEEAVEDGKSKLAEIVESRITSSIESFYSSTNNNNSTSDYQGLISDVKVESRARLKNIIIDKTHYVEKSEGGYRYYALVKVPEKVLQIEMNRLEIEFMEKISSVDKNIEEGKNLLKKGLVGLALEKFIQAGINSTKVPDREDNFNNIVQLIQNTLAKIEFEKINDRQNGTRNSGLQNPVRVRLIYRDNGKTIPVRQTKLRFYLRNNAGSSYDRSVITNDQGYAESRITKFKKSGDKVKLYVRLDLTESLEQVELLVQDKWRVQKAMIEDSVDDTKTTFQFSVAFYSIHNSLVMK